MAEQYHGMAIGIFELDSECACFVALDAAAKAAAVQIQGVERNRLGAGACVKMRGKYFRCKSSYGSGDPYGRANRKSCFPHGDRIPVRGDRNGDCNDDYKIRRD